MKTFDHAEYLGDAVYASFDGYHIWLTTGDGNDQRIALEPSVFRGLVEYEARLRCMLTAQRTDAAPRFCAMEDCDQEPSIGSPHCAAHEAELLNSQVQP